MDILLTTFGIEKDEVVSQVAAKGVTLQLMDAALGNILVKVDAVTTQLTFADDGGGNADGDGLFCQQLFQRIQLMIGINEGLLKSGEIGSYTGGIIWEHIYYRV